MKSKSSAEETIRFNMRLPWLWAVVLPVLIIWTSTISSAQICAPTPSGLVSWWRGESNANDTISTNHGTLQNGATFAAGKSGLAFNLDGIDDYVQVGNKPELVMSNAMTIEAWIYPTGSGNGPEGNGTIVCKEGEYVIERVPDGTIRWAIAAGPVWTFTATPLVAPLNAWTHVALVYSNGVTKIYGNGSLVQSTSGSSVLTDIYPTLNDFQIGGRQAASVNFKGLIDEVSVYQSALTDGDIAGIYSAGSAGKCLPIPPLTCTATPSGLVSWWRGESSANDTFNTNHGTLQNGATFVAGKVGQAFGLDGVDDYVQIGNRPELVMSNALTVEAWIYRTGSGSGSGGEGAIVNKEGEYEIGVISDGTVRWSIKDPSSPMAWTVTPLVAPLNTWTHVAMVYGGGMVRIYGNGSLIQSYSGPGSIGDELPGLDDFQIGGRQAISENFKGSIDEVSVYRSALTDGEIAAIYSAGSFGKCTGLTAPVVLVNPTNQTVFEGSPAVFSVSAGGTSPLSYQWRKDSIPVSNATNATLSFAGVSTNDAGGYDVVITNTVGSVTSIVATLSVTPNPTSCVGPPSDLVGWWRGNNNSDDNIGGLNGTLAGGATFVAGKVGQAFSLDGVDDYVQIGDRPALVMSNVFTFEAWIYPTGSGSGSDGSGIIVNREGEYEIGWTPDGTIRFALATPGLPWVWTVTSLVAPLNTWTHLALVYNSGVVKIYGNGSLVQTYGGPSIIGDVLSGQNDFRIGGRQAGNEYFKGLIDEVSVYRSALTAGDIASVYYAGSFGKCMVPVAPFITEQPANKTVTVGANATFTAGVAGSSPLSFQWLYNSNAIVDATNSSLTLNNVQVSQAGAYSVVATNSLGSATSSNAILTVNFPTAVIRVLGSNVPSGATFSVPVQLVANGNENALGFTLNYTTSRLSYEDITLGSGAAGGSLLVNTSQTNLGRLGVAIALPSGSTFAAGTQELVRVSFKSAVLASQVSTTLNFGDLPVGRELSDAPGNPLPVNFANASIIIAAAQYEGDVSPRPNGSKTVTITDWVLVGRYAALLDAPTNSSEFQRADCAPRSSLGNGALTVSDWVQAGRYAASLDPLTVAGGPTSGSGLVLSSLRSSGGGGPANLTGRQVMASSSSLLQGDTTTVSVYLVSQ
ncbi:MAG: hypothetical protein HOP33_01315, partial [Verrucomicrobia bacterium]|nr:hypothetical protein [Verrucomicrobiota bacterium]